MKKTIYDIIFCVFAVVAVYIAVCDLTTGCSVLQQRIDLVISIIFITDYVIRLAISDDKKDFFRSNIFDLIAIIPFTSLLKVFRIFKVFRLLKLLKIAKLSAYFARLYNHVKFFFDINGLKYIVVVCLVCILSGGVAIHVVEGMSLIDGIWWSFVTATTVGYGDISPATSAGRIVAAVLMIVGIGFIGSLTSTLTALFFKRHEHKNEIITVLQAQLDKFDDLSDGEVDAICQTLKVLQDNKNK